MTTERIGSYSIEREIDSRLDPKTQWDLWVLPLDGDRTPRTLIVQTK